MHDVLVMVVVVMVLNHVWDRLYPAAPAKPAPPRPPKPPAGPLVWGSGILLAIVMSIASIAILMRHF